LKRIQSLKKVFQTKIYILSIRSTLNNIYVTVTNSYGRILFGGSGGFLKLKSSKRNSNYIFELLLLKLIKKLKFAMIENLIVRMDFSSLRKRKLVCKILQKSEIHVLGIQLKMLKAFNGVRLRKKRRI
jgi:ribosomal protein S11